MVSFLKIVKVDRPTPPSDDCFPTRTAPFKDDKVEHMFIKVGKYPDFGVFHDIMLFMLKDEFKSTNQVKKALRGEHTSFVFMSEEGQLTSSIVFGPIGDGCGKPGETKVKLYAFCLEHEFLDPEYPEEPPRETVVRTGQGLGTVLLGHLLALYKLHKTDTVGISDLPFGGKASAAAKFFILNLGFRFHDGDDDATGFRLSKRLVSQLQVKTSKTISK